MVSAPSCTGLLAQFAGSDLPPSLFEAKVPVFPRGERTHLTGVCAAAWRIGPASSGQAAVMVRVADLNTKVTCPRCLTADLVRAPGPFAGGDDRAKVLFGLQQALDATRDGQRLVERLTAATGVPVAIGRIRRFQQAADRAVELIGRGLPSLRCEPAVACLADDVLEALRLTAVALTSSSADDRRRAVLFDKVRHAMLPKSWNGPLPAVDETTVLVGVTPLMRLGDLAKELISACAVPSENDRTVLLCPRFVFDFLQRRHTPGSSERVLLQAVALPSGADVTAVATAAAAFWSPHDDGPLRDLGQAVEAALLLVDAPPAA